jgi:hypothetical protein
MVEQVIGAYLEDLALIHQAAQMALPEALALVAAMEVEQL